MHGSSVREVNFFSKILLPWRTLYLQKFQKYYLKKQKRFMPLLEFLVHFLTWFNLSCYFWKVWNKTIAWSTLEKTHFNNHNKEKKTQTKSLILKISPKQFNYETSNHFILHFLLESTFYVVYFSWSYLPSGSHHSVSLLWLFSYFEQWVRYNFAPTQPIKHFFCTSITFPLSLWITLEIITSKVFSTLNFNDRKSNLFFKMIIKHSFLIKPTGPMNNVVI